MLHRVPKGPRTVLADEIHSWRNDISRLSRVDLLNDQGADDIAMIGLVSFCLFSPQFVIGLLLKKICFEQRQDRETLGMRLIDILF